MKRLALGAALMLTPPLANPASAGGIIERACLSSQRSAASSTLCTCIQAVADQVLAPAEQRKGAAFFDDPHKSQETRQSASSDDAAFWQKWKGFGATAAKHCS